MEASVRIFAALAATAALLTLALSPAHALPADSETKRIRADLVVTCAAVQYEPVTTDSVELAAGDCEPDPVADFARMVLGALYVQARAEACPPGTACILPEPDEQGMPDLFEWDPAGELMWTVPGVCGGARWCEMILGSIECDITCPRPR